MERRPPANAAAVAAGALALVAGIALRIRAMSGRELWLDESHSALLAGMPIGERLSFVLGDVHPPLYFLSLGPWTDLFGDGPTALRSFSLLAATLAAVTIGFAAARRLQSALAGVFVLTLFLLSPVLVYYSVEIRMYALALLAAVLALAWLPDPRRQLAEQRARIVGFVTAGVLTFYTHYVGLFVIAGLGAWLVLRALLERRGLRPAAVLGLAMLLLVLPWSPVLIHQRNAKAELRRQELAGMADPTALNYGNTSTLPEGLTSRLRSMVENAASAAGVSPGETPLGTALLALPIGLAAVGILVGALRGAPASQLALLVTAATALGCVVIGATARRFLILAVPFWLLGFGEVLVRLRPRPWLALGFAGGLLGVYGYGAIRVSEAVSSRPLETLVAHVATGYQPGDLVVFNAAYGEIPFRYYARRQGVEVRSRGFPVDIAEWWERQSFKGWGGPVIHVGDLARFTEEIQREQAGRAVWLVLFDTRYYDPGDSLAAVLSRQALAVREMVNNGGYRLLVLDFKPTEPPPG